MAAPRYLCTHVWDVYATSRHARMAHQLDRQNKKNMISCSKYKYKNRLAINTKGREFQR